MESPSLYSEDVPRYVMRPAHPVCPQYEQAAGRLCSAGRYSIVCRQGAQVSGCSSVQKASAMPPSWLKDSWAVRWCACTQSAVLPEKR